MSGGVTIVKLNSPATGNNGINGKSVAMANTQTSAKIVSPPILNGSLSISPPPSSNVPTGTSQITTTTGGGHIVTIHTSSITSATTGTTPSAATSGTTGTSSTSGTATIANGNVNPPHTGYTRRAKLGDSRSTGRLHSAGNTHRSMTRLNIAGK